MKINPYTAIAVCSACILFATHAPAMKGTLVTPKSVGDLKLGMSRAGAIEVLGKPRKAIQHTCKEFSPGKKYEVLAWNDFELYIDSDRVVAIRTTSKSVATKEGYRIGTVMRSVRKVETNACTGDMFIAFPDERVMIIGRENDKRITVFVIGDENVCGEDC